MSQTSFDWDRLRIFYIVAEAGSFTEAGKKLHLSQSAVSRQIAALEDSLGIPLFHRHARGLVMTEAGRTLFTVAMDLNTKLSNASSMLKEGKEKAAGSIHITTTAGFGTLCLTGMLQKFLDQYPEIKIRLSIEDYDLDMTRAKADVGILPHPPNHPGLIQRHLLDYHFYLFASKEYLSRNGEPKSIKDLSNHHLIGFNSEGVLPYDQINWHLGAGLEGEPPRKPLLECNNLLTIAHAAEAGIGICYLPSYFIGAFPKLLRVLPNIEGPVLPAYFVFPEALRNSKRVHVLRDYLVNELKHQISGATILVSGS
jgi:DNA-binding transcriptional LysR family regulator